VGNCEIEKDRFLCIRKLSLEGLLKVLEDVATTSVPMRQINIEVSKAVFSAHHARLVNFGALKEEICFVYNHFGVF
jgi:hypothetical protein